MSGPRSFAGSDFTRRQWAASAPTCRTCTIAQWGLPAPKPTIVNAPRAASGQRRRPNNFGYCTYLDALFSLRCFADIVQLGAFISAKDVSESMAALNAVKRHSAVAGGLATASDDPLTSGDLQTLGDAQTSTSGDAPAPNSSDSQAENSGDAHMHGSPTIEGTLCLCIGDGQTPRTAVLAAFLRRWRCVSIDPELHEKWSGTHATVQGLVGFRGTLDEFMATLRPVRKAGDGDPDSTPDCNRLTNPILTPGAGEVESGEVQHLILLCVHSHARFIGCSALPKICARYGHPPMTVVSLPCCPQFRHVRDIGRAPDVKYDDDCVFSDCRSVEVWNFKAGEGGVPEDNAVSES